MIAAIIAVVVVSIAAFIAVRSATPPEPPPLAVKEYDRDPSAAVTSETTPVVPPDAPRIEPPPGDAPPRVEAPPSVAAPILAGAPVITEDLRLDEVLAAATESVEPTPHPHVRLLAGIAISGLVFAAAALAVVRSAGSLFGGFFKP